MSKPKLRIICILKFYKNKYNRLFIIKFKTMNTTFLQLSVKSIIIFL